MDDRTANLVATLATMIGTGVADATSSRGGMSGAAPAGLAVLLGEPGISVDAFARTVGVTGSGGVRLADRLASAGLVERRAGKDARAVSLWLTPAGEAAAAEVLAARRDVVLAATSVLEPDEVAALTAIAEKVLAGATRGRDQADWLCRLCDLDACPSARCPVEQAVP